MEQNGATIFDSPGGHMGATTMMDEPIRSGEFNAAIRGIRDSLDGVIQRLGAVETLQLASVQAKVTEAEERGVQKANLAHIEKRIDRTSLGLWMIAVGFSGQLLWWIFKALVAK